MSTITLQDPLDALLTEATNGTSLLKDRNTLHFTHIPTLIHHRDIEQINAASSTQALQNAVSARSVSILRICSTV